MFNVSGWIEKSEERINSGGVVSMVFQSYRGLASNTGSARVEAVWLSVGYLISLILISSSVKQNNNLAFRRGKEGLKKITHLKYWVPQNAQYVLHAQYMLYAQIVWFPFFLLHSFCKTTTEQCVSLFTASMKWEWAEGWDYSHGGVCTT